ncbi:hypothetical protein BDP27DRAFT_1428384 [Rhodocollybia butyracea]|uniref:Uncharacterized protein n=1 Tax=Rhodocollybia butyracea TaxID=206335 RepID=A0A9P5PES9_9AGAR|nr:hypothetical protein BDP27DRAFT_1428384 [Rhodocollybia butyracea]
MSSSRFPGGNFEPYFNHNRTKGDCIGGFKRKLVTNCFGATLSLFSTTMSARYVKGYALDYEKVANHLDITNCDENMAQIFDVDLSVMEFLRKQTHITGNIHTFTMAYPLGSRRTDSMLVRVLSVGLDALSQDLNELKKKKIEYPQYMKELAEALFSGPDVFEISPQEDPLISAPGVHITYASYAGFPS